MTLANKAKAIYSIGRQLASQYDKKRLDIETNAISFLYKPYEPLTKSKYNEIIKFTEEMLNDQKFYELILFSDELIILSLEGLRYYHNYYQTPLLVLVSLSFFGWIMVLLKALLEQKYSAPTEASNGLKGFVHSNNVKRPVLNSVFLFICSVACYLVYGKFLIYYLLHTFCQYTKFTIHA